MLAVNARMRYTLIGVVASQMFFASTAGAVSVGLSDVPMFVGSWVEPNIYLSVDDSVSMGWSYMGDGIDKAVDFDTKRAKSSTWNKLYFDPNEIYTVPVDENGVSLGNATFTAAWNDGFIQSEKTSTCPVNLETNYRPTWGSDHFDNCDGEDTNDDGDGNEYSDDVAGVAEKAYYYRFDNLTNDNDINNDENYTKVYIEDKDKQNFANWYSYHRNRLLAAKTAITESFSKFGTGFRLSYQNIHSRELSDLARYSGKTRSDFFDWVSNIANQDLLSGTALRASLKNIGDTLKRNDDPYRDDPSEPTSTARSCRQNFHIMLTDGEWSGDASGPGNADNTAISMESLGSYGAPYTPQAPYKDDNVNFLADFAFDYWITDLSDTLDNNVPATITKPFKDDEAGEFWHPENDPATWQHLVNFIISFGVKGELDYPGDYQSLMDDSKQWGTNHIDDAWHAAINSRGSFFLAMDSAALVEKLSKTMEEIVVVRNVVSAAPVSMNSGSVSTDTRLFQVKFDTTDWTGKLLSLPISDGSSYSNDTNETSNSTCTVDDEIGDVCSPEWEASCKLDGGLCGATNDEEVGLDWDTGRNIITYYPDTGNPDTGIGIPFRWSNLYTDDSSSTDQQDLLNGDDNKGEARLNYIRGDKSQEATDQDDASICSSSESCTDSCNWYGQDYPLCMSQDSGWGWENNQSCIGAITCEEQSGEGGIVSNCESSNSNDCQFRYRNSLLGDIIHSSPLYIGVPERSYPDDLEDSDDLGNSHHSTFRSTHREREGMVYVGANDGMLHGFSASTGIEKIAYVPNIIYKKLPLLTDTNYSHSSFVDGQLEENDVFLNDAWQTVLVGGLGYGGQGIFALNVTDPSQFSESSASDIVLWEFSDANDSDIGYTFGKPKIRKLNNGAWAAIFGNGYDSTEADGSVSETGDAAIYIVDISNGALIKKLSIPIGTEEDPTGAGRPNGISGIQPIDVNNDFKIDFIYAGDLFGNIWRFNLEGNVPENWDVAFSDKPLYTAKDDNGKAQPITTAPKVGQHTTLVGTMVYFGTGKYLGSNDPADRSQQTFYAIWDRWFDNDGNTADNENEFAPLSRDDLLEQEVLDVNKVQFDSAHARVTTKNMIDWDDHKGWYLDLAESGERVFQDPLLRNGRIIFVTVSPAADPCEPEASSWLMELDAYSGSRLDTSPFDYSGNGEITHDDMVEIEIDGKKVKVAGSGIRLGSEGDFSGIDTMPAILNMPSSDSERKYMGTSGAKVKVVGESSGKRTKQSWQEIMECGI